MMAVPHTLGRDGSSPAIERALSEDKANPLFVERVLRPLVSRRTGVCPWAPVPTRIERLDGRPLDSVPVCASASMVTLELPLTGSAHRLFLNESPSSPGVSLFRRRD